MLMRKVRGRRKVRRRLFSKIERLGLRLHGQGSRHRHRRSYAADGHLSKGNVASSALSARIPCRLV
jgi:hypothetical protein